MFSKNDENPMIETELPNPWAKGKSNQSGVNYDGDQHDKRHGGLASHKIGLQSEPMGVDWVMSEPDDKNDSLWEKSMGVFQKATGTFRDMDIDKVHSIDLKNDRSGGIGLKEKDNYHDC